MWYKVKYYRISCCSDTTIFECTPTFLRIALWVTMETIQFLVTQMDLIFKTILFGIKVVLLNNLTSKRNCPRVTSNVFITPPPSGVLVCPKSNRIQEDQWSYKRSPDYWPGVNTTVKNKMHCCENVVKISKAVRRRK